MSLATLAPETVPPPARLSPRAIAKLAARALWDELALCPKPGLVSLRDAGAHDDMSARTFVKSLFALRRPFASLAAAGAAAAPFATLRALGMRAEADMLRATGGVNTHRGAIFCVGLLCAAAGRACTIGEAPDDDTLRATLHDVWGAALVAHVAVCSTRSHGGQVAQRHGAGGARAQAARGFPDVFDIALPALRAARAAGAGVRVARLRALLALMARVDDTNVLYRGGEAGLRLVQQRAREASASADILRASEAMHSELVVRRLSPGGCADLLAAALFVDTLQDAPG